MERLFLAPALFSALFPVPGVVSAAQEGPRQVYGMRKLEEAPHVALLGPPGSRTGAAVLRMAQHPRLSWEPPPGGRWGRVSFPCQVGLPRLVITQDS